jgi:hypothetical protein
MDFVVRGSSAVEVVDRFLRWMGAPVRPRFLVGPDAEQPTRRQVRWPTVRPQTSRHRLIQLLARVLRVSPKDRDGAAEIDQCLRDAWQQIQPLLSQRQDGRVLRLDEEAVLREGRDAWLCPVTRRVLDITLAGYTPYLTQDMVDPRCAPVQMPMLPEAFWRRAEGSRYEREEIEQWLRSSVEIQKLEHEGVWNELSTRIAAQAAYYQVAEHSAQQSPVRLQELEGEFKAGRINLLSCSTTMEMGVDIGGLSAVAMNNPPPSAANYLQRAGRAGRRGEARAFSLTLCKSTPQGEAVFQNPLWPFTTPLHVPDVMLGSERIVQRHVNSLVLTRFLSTVLTTATLPKLQSGAFFESPAEGVSTVAARFEEWLTTDARGDEWVIEGVRKLVRRSEHEGAPLGRLLGRAADQIRAAGEAWVAELDPLLHEQQLLAAAGSEAVAARNGVHWRLVRMREEYLLRELAVRNFLPGYGFPTDVVPFVTTTAEDLSRTRSAGNGGFGRIDNRTLSQGFPSRELSVAIRDYAPGATVVLDGRVLESQGLTLNWKVPASDQQLREVQALRWAWRCKRCGNTGVSNSWPSGCASELCQGSDAYLDRERFIQPAGFSVALSAEPTNDLTHDRYLPVEEPWISTGAEPWQALPRPELGRFRYSGQGQLFAYSRGRHGQGYAICLRCGKADSEDPEPRELPYELQGHYPLRGGADRTDDGRCSGNEALWAIQRQTWLGVARETDVFELQLRRADGGALVNSEVTAASLAVALRQALAATIGIEEREIGWAAVPARDPDTGEQTRSIVLYDTASGGAGFVAQAAAHLPALFRRAAELLACPRDCDAACQACLLSADTWFSVDRMNRHAALEVLSNEFLSGLQLSAEHQLFGAGTQVEFEPLLVALGRTLRSGTVETLRLTLGGDPKQWELDRWDAGSRLGRWRSEGLEVELLIPANMLSGLDAPARNRLAALIEAGLATVGEVAPEVCRVGDGYLIAEAGGAAGSVRFAVRTEEALVPGEAWSVGSSSAFVLRAHSTEVLRPLTELGKVRTAESLRGLPPGSVAALGIADDLDGAIGLFGDRFWELVLAAVPELAARFDAGTSIAQVTYQDRYVCSPLTLRTLLEVVRSLRKRGVLKPDTSMVRLETIPINTPYRQARLVSHDWDAGVDRDEIFANAAAAAGFRGEVAVVQRHLSAHARELTLTWHDGATWRLRLDEGFGFLQSNPAVRHDFALSATEQGAALGSKKYDIAARNPTTFYAFGVEAGTASPVGA